MKITHLLVAIAACSALPALAQDAARGARLYADTAKLTGKPVATCVACHADIGTLREVLRNRRGGWWHPIHIHLESHQEVFFKARDVTGAHVHMRNPLYPMPGGDNGAEISGPTSGDSAFWNLDIKHDTSVLGPNTEVHILMRFRTFQGPFVFHCHNLNHEDMRMMFQFDPRLEGAPATDLPMRPEFWFYTEEIP